MVDRERIKVILALLLAALTARGLASQEPIVPKPGLAAPQSQAQKVAAQAQSDVSMQDTHSAFEIRVNLVQVQVIVRDDKVIQWKVCAKRISNYTTTVNCNRSALLRLRMPTRPRKGPK